MHAGTTANGVLSMPPQHSTLSPKSLAAALLAFCISFTCFQDAVGLRKCKVHTEEAQLFLQELSQLRESNPGKGHELDLHVQLASQPQFILINVLSAAVKLDKII